MPALQNKAIINHVLMATKDSYVLRVESLLNHIKDTLQATTQQETLSKILYDYLSKFACDSTYNKEFSKKINRTEYLYVSARIRDAKAEYALKDKKAKTYKFSIYLQNPHENATIRFSIKDGIHLFSIQSETISAKNLSAKEFYKFFRHPYK